MARRKRLPQEFLNVERMPHRAIADGEDAVAGPEAQAVGRASRANRRHRHSSAWPCNRRDVQPQPLRQLAHGVADGVLRLLGVHASPDHERHEDDRGDQKDNPRRQHRPHKTMILFSCPVGPDGPIAPSRWLLLTLSGSSGSHLGGRVAQGLPQPLDLLGHFGPPGVEAGESAVHAHIGVEGD